MSHGVNCLKAHKLCACPDCDPVTDTLRLSKRVISWPAKACFSASLSSANVEADMMHAPKQDK